LRFPGLDVSPTPVEASPGEVLDQLHSSGQCQGHQSDAADPPELAAAPAWREDSRRSRPHVPSHPARMGAVLWAVLQVGVVSDLPGPGSHFGQMGHAEIQEAERPSAPSGPLARADCPTAAAPLCALADGGTACGWTIGAG